MRQAFGRLCVKVQCAGLADPRLVGRTLQGLLQAGGWACVVDAHALSAPLASLVSQLLVEIASAVAEHRLTERIIFRVRPATDLRKNPSERRRKPIERR